MYTNDWSEVAEIVKKHREQTTRAIDLLEESTERIKLLLEIKDSQAAIIKKQEERIKLLEKQCSMLKEQILLKGE